MSNAVVAAPSEPEWAALVAIDWADQKNFWRLLPAGSRKSEAGELDSTPEAVEVWAANLQQRFGGRPIAVILEQRRIGIHASRLLREVQLVSDQQVAIADLPANELDECGKPPSEQERERDAARVEFLHLAPGRFVGVSLVYLGNEVVEKPLHLTQVRLTRVANDRAPSLVTLEAGLDAARLQAGADVLAGQQGDDLPVQHQSVEMTNRAADVFLNLKVCDGQ